MFFWNTAQNKMDAILLGHGVYKTWMWTKIHSVTFNVKKEEKNARFHDTLMREQKSAKISSKG